MKKGLLAGDTLRRRIPSGRRPEVKYVGLDWAYRTAQWCALDPGGEIAGEGRFAADRDGLARLVLELGDEVTACLEMMSGALWVRDELVACGWQVEVADACKVRRPPARSRCSGSSSASLCVRARVAITLSVASRPSEQASPFLTFARFSG